MIIKVLKKHIFAGKRSDCFNCPIALAIKEAIGEAIGDATAVYTSMYHIRLIYNNTRYVFDTPFKVCNFMYDFDRNLFPEEIEFDLPLCEPVAV